MATIDKRKGPKDLTYRARVRVRGQTRTATFERKTDAKDWARTVESELKRGRYVPDTEALRRTLGDMVERCLRETLPRKSTRRDTRNVTRYLRWWCCGRIESEILASE